MTPEEALATIRAEGLGRYRWFEDATNDADIVAIQRTESGWVVFATDERGTSQGRREFAEEEPALENFLSRLRSINSVAAWREKVRRENAPRYFVRELRVDGRLVPARLFRRRETDHGPVDEFLVDVDTWAPDTRGVLDRGIRFPLDSDLEEISDAAAREIFAMVARREYLPLTRR
ncbi:Imm59 family immunity protein [Microbacterium sp. B19]|uniref:Imm59 family immunity protein n=1 Tax=Microbacterium sp. B19 TaxID=96765 RepID=UPI00034BD749|nr:Imm59 family immunity protein [Microbacterium sp. B19]